jgi:hypothetical protein
MHGVVTIYSRIGDLFAYLCAVGMIFLTARACVSHQNPPDTGLKIAFPQDSIRPSP